MSCVPLQRIPKRSPGQWRLHPDSRGFVLTVDGSTRALHGQDADRISVHRGRFRRSVRITGPEPLRLYGISRSAAAELAAAVELHLLRHRAAPTLSAALTWRRAVTRGLEGAVRQGRWITRDASCALANGRPAALAPDLRVALSSGPLHDSLTADERAAVSFLDVDLVAWVAEHNAAILAAEKQDRAAFFDTVESTPLTEEQVEAVVCYDNAVLVIAAAGSGKTSVMVARAAYAVARGFTTADRILLLAFNQKAARELQARVTTRFRALGLDPAGVRATTFHAYGLSVLGQASGRKPRIARWLEHEGGDVEAVDGIITDLCRQSPTFRRRWDLFRLLYARPSAPPGEEENTDYDAATKRTGFRTFNGEVVRSEGERLIANWLFLHGVRYDYERDYPTPPTAEHSQYRPDFYYPDIDAWHEHWALDEHGRPPASFAYLDYTDIDANGRTTATYSPRTSGSHGSTGDAPDPGIDSIQGQQ